ncbi:sensor histidine kinase [Murimonas intestini]|uniref:histidine kinase n=1 Tax=Murimonas intestini TaxID=1337051 RepID=A0AB73SYI7_9FIRM|nr:HAMP domain-containing sensor histidine kinase [Murimonas intestini]MCR1840270.1 HAMP domain-containing histidine kinase [Murimonas intestini]MCR1868266.1 HAMP domain-containing histidine kinase [Murimonas intestini]MCR1885616.1 HAMP domain-containing histidine kinase [Murimonas intestini]
MEIYLGILCTVLLAAVFGLLVRLYLIRRSVREIGDSFADRLKTDTNTLIDVSCNDKTIKYLASLINEQLKTLRRQSHRYIQGDNELKEAVTNISHDLRTPLTAICGYLDMLEGEEMTENARRYLLIIRNRASALKQLTEELFQYSIIISSGEEQEKEDIVVNSLLEESVAACYAVLKEKGIIPLITMTEEKVRRCLNKNTVSRIFGNIISNAVKYSDGDLSIVLDKDGTVVFSNRAKGLDQIAVGRLFDRFFTVETGRGSTGLGLSIARSLTEQAGGSIHADYKKETLYITVQL